MLVGIDPGFTGAIAILDHLGHLTVLDMPVHPSAKGRTELNVHELAQLLHPEQAFGASWDGPRIAVLEQVGPMPNQGVTSVFRFGQCFGAIQMALAGHGYEVHMAAPTKWKKHFGLSSDKGVSRQLASRRFPASAKSFVRVKDDGRAEAALLALYGAETVLPKHPSRPAPIPTTQP